MTMQQVLYVLTVARCRNVSRAAQELILSQPALSQQLRRLEAELGYELFFRTTSGMELTPADDRHHSKNSPRLRAAMNRTLNLRGSSRRKMKPVQRCMSSDEKNSSTTSPAAVISDTRERERRSPSKPTIRWRIG